MILQPFPERLLYVQVIRHLSEVQKFYKNKQEKYNQDQRADYLKKYGITISFVIHISAF